MNDPNFWILGTIVTLWRLFAVILFAAPLMVASVFVKRKRWGRWRSLSLMTLGAAAGYLFSLPIVFDFSRAAISHDEEYFHNRPVALGPEPYFPFCYGGNLDIPGGWDFYGDEPIWPLYRPVCYLWRNAKGYEPPSAWR